MAHADYNCCALCDCKMSYVEAGNATTKKEVCSECMRTLHVGGVMVYTGGELEAWIKENPEKAREVLPGMGYCQCFYENAVDAAFNAAEPAV